MGTLRATCGASRSSALPPSLSRSLHSLLSPACHPSTGTISRPSTQRSPHGLQAASSLLAFFLQTPWAPLVLSPTLAIKKELKAWPASAEFQLFKGAQGLWEATRPSLIRSLGWPLSLLMSSGFAAAQSFPTSGCRLRQWGLLDEGDAGRAQREGGERGGQDRGRHH